VQFDLLNSNIDVLNAGALQLAASLATLAAIA
jgi:hypothetical protein